MSKKAYRIAQVGTFDYKNYGDILFPDILATELSKYINVSEIVLFSPIGGVKPFDSRIVFPISELENEHLKKPFDAIVCGGGDIVRFDEQVVSDLTKYRMNNTSFELWGTPIVIGEKYCIPVVFNAVGVPFRFAGIEKKLIEILLQQVEYIAVRDQVSSSFLEECTTNADVNVVPDSVVLVEQTYDENKLEQVFSNVKSSISLPESYYIFQCSIFEDDISVVEFEDSLRQIEKWTGSQCILMPIGYVHEDSKVLMRLNKSLEKPFRYIERELSPIEMLAVIRHARCFIGTSLHGCLTSIIQGKPAIGLNYVGLTKMTGFFRLIGLEECEVNSIKEISEEILSKRLTVEQKESLIIQCNRHMQHMAQIIIEGRKEETNRINFYQKTMSVLLGERREKVFSKVYYGENDAYSEKKRDIFYFSPDEKVIEICLNVPKGINEIRFDPVEYSACIISDLKVSCGDADTVEMVKTNGQVIDNLILFSSTDPQVYLRLPQKENLTIHIKCGISRISHPEYLSKIEFACNLEKQLALVNDENHKYKAQLDKMNHEKQTMKEDYEKRLTEISGEMQSIQVEKEYYRNAFQTMQNATLWKATSPLRRVLDKVKDKTGLMKPGVQAPVYVRTFRFFKKNGLVSTIGRIWIEVAGYKPQSRKKRVLLSGSLSKPLKQRSTNCLGFIHDDAEIIAAENISVSVVIPTKNGGEDFSRLMKMLGGQKGIRQIEIVIVDSGSTDRTTEIAAEYGAKVIRIKPEKFTHSYARNIGVNNAGGDYVLVMTQDAMPTSLYWIRKFYHALTHQPGIAAVSCGEFPRVDADLYHRAFTWNHYKFLGSYENDRVNECPSSHDGESMHRAAQLSDIACFMKRETAIHYPYQGEFAEDLDLGMRLLKDGYKIGFLGHELAIHSHNRQAYYYLRRRFVEFMTLRKLFADQDFIRTEFEELVCEIAYLIGKLDGCFKAEKMLGLAEGIRYTEFRDAFMSEFRMMKSGNYTCEYGHLNVQSISWLDKQTKDVLQGLFGNCKKLENASEQYRGTMVLATEGYLNILFNYMAESYEYVNNEIFIEFRECIGKIIAGVIGTYFAYCNLTEIENGTVIEEHRAFYKMIGAGV